MAKREIGRNEMLENITNIIADMVLKMPVGAESSITRLVNEHLEKQGYIRKHLGIDIGHAWTKDDGKTYLVSEDDLFEILDRVRKAIIGKCKLDYSKYKNMVVGLPYNLIFTKK